MLLVGAVLYVGRAILLPIFAAAVVAMTLAPVIRFAQKRGISPWITALAIVACALAVLGIGAVAMAGPVSEWIARAPEIGATIKERLSVLDAPLAALRELERSFFGSNTRKLPRLQILSFPQSLSSLRPRANFSCSSER